LRRHPQRPNPSNGSPSFWFRGVGSPSQNSAIVVKATIEGPIPPEDLPIKCWPRTPLFIFLLSVPLSTFGSGFHPPVHMLPYITRSFLHSYKLFFFPDRYRLFCSLEPLYCPRESPTVPCCAVSLPEKDFSLAYRLVFKRPELQWAFLLTRGRFLLVFF